MVVSPVKFLNYEPTQAVNRPQMASTLVHVTMYVPFYILRGDRNDLAGVPLRISFPALRATGIMAMNKLWS